MARQFRLLIASALALAHPAFGQTPEAQKPETPVPASSAEATGTKPEPGNVRPKRALSPDFDNVRKAIDALTPEQHKRFQENFKRWNDLPPGDKKLLREREEFRKSKMATDLDAAIRATGLDFTKEQREQFVNRYTEERRKLEQQIQKEFDERRKQRVKELLEKLKSEFTADRDKPSTPGALNVPLTPPGN